MPDLASPAGTSRVRRTPGGGTPSAVYSSWRGYEPLAAAKCVASTLLFATALYYSYRDAVSPAFSYAGLSYRPPVAGHYAVALVATIAVALVLPRAIARPSDFMQWILFATAGAPAILIPQYSAVLPQSEATKTGLSVAGSLILIRTIAALRPRSVMPRMRVSSHSFWIALAAISTLIYSYLALYAGFRFSLLAFADVYDARSDFASAPIPYIGYILPIQYNVINPVFITRGVYSRRALPFLFGAAGQVVIYMTTGRKAVLLSIAGLAVGAWLFKSSRRLTGHKILALAATAIAGSFLIDKLTGSLVWTALFVRRFIVIPGILTAAYVAVFQNRPKMLFSDSLFVWLDNPYPVRAVYIVGAEFVGDAQTAANVSLFGDGYLNYGYIGMFVEAAILGMLLWFVDDAARGLPTPVTSLLFFMPTVALASGSIFTVMLTHGFAAAIIACGMLPKTGWDRRTVASGGRVSPAVEPLQAKDTPPRDQEKEAIPLVPKPRLLDSPD